MTLFFLTVALILGLTLTRGNLAITIPISVIYLLFLLYRIGAKKSGVALVMFSIGLSMSFVRIQNNPKNNIYDGIVIDAKESYYIFASKFEKFYVYDRECDKEVGDVLSLSGKVEELLFTTYESQFDFKTYLNNKNVYRSITVKNEITKFRTPFRINQRKRQFLANFNDDTASLIDSFLFNHKDYNSTPIELADSLNIVSILSMNGMYLYLILSFMDFLLKYKFKERTASLISTLFFVPYLLFSFTKFGVIRVITMRLLSYLNKEIFTKKKSYLELLSIQLLFFLLFDYSLIYQQAFYIGFIISFMLIYIRTYSKKVNKKLYPLLIVTFITVLMIPMSFENKSEFHLFTPILQMILLPIHMTFIVLSLLSFYFYPLKLLLNSFTKGILVIYKDLSYIDLSIPVSKLLPIFITIYYLSLLLTLFYFESKRWKHMYITLGIFITVIIGSIIPIKPLLTNSVHFINVGQGDSILIQNKTHSVMIDTGGNKSFDMAKQTLIPFLKKNHIYKLDALITSHDDFDHSGAKESLMKNYKVDKYISQRSQFPFVIGDITLTNINTYNSTDENDSSLVLTMDFMDKKWLFTGDASITVEKFLIDKNIDLDCDILKVGHHGSKTSTCEEFLTATTPNEAIISVGAKNYYGHPNDEVVNRLKRRNIKIRRTDLEGTISFVEFA